MTFNVALSGIRAASDELEVIGNNVSNASTTGFKASRADFADVYAASVLGNGGNSIGAGVQLSGVNQQFVQGNIGFTGNSLDLAISGRGFFSVSNGGDTNYTRAGAFKVDANGYIINNAGSRLMGYTTNSSGDIVETLTEIQLNTNNLTPSTTSSITASVNLDASAVVPSVGTFDATNPNSYNDSSSTTIYDSLGNQHVMTQYFIKTNANEWDVVVQVDGRNVGPDAGGPPPVPSEARFGLAFNSDGAFDAANSDAISIVNWTPLDASGNPNQALGPGDSDFTISMSASTQFATDFSVVALSQNGVATGRLANLSVESDGTILARYTNGQTRALGQVTLAGFSNESGLQPLGNTSWAETVSSGTALHGKANSGSLGVIQSGALEDSTVNITEELVGMIVAQRNFQANAQTIRTADQVTQAIINIR